MKRTPLFVFPLLLLMFACKGEEAPVTPEPTKEELTIKNAYIVQDAVEAFAAQNGSYPIQEVELRAFLPNGEKLVKPFTGAVTEPSNGSAGLPGQVGYVPCGPDSTGRTVCYVISAFGEVEMILTLAP